MKLNTKVKKFEEMKKNVKGITLVALVVTIIVLLILAGVAINLTIGNNGIFRRAQAAVIVNENASVYEQLQFVIADYQMGDIDNNTNTDMLAKLKEDGYVNNDDTVNVENLMGRSMQTGNGSIEDGDVYVIEQRQRTASSATSDTNSSMDYYLIYYYEDKTETNLGIAFEIEVEEEPMYRLQPTEFFYEEDGKIIYYGSFNMLDRNDNIVEFENRVVIKQNDITYFDGDATEYIKNNTLYVLGIFDKFHWNLNEIIEVTVYKDGVSYSWNGYITWPAV